MNEIHKAETPESKNSNIFNPDKRIEINPPNNERYGKYDPDKRITNYDYFKMNYTEITAQDKDTLCRETGWSRDVVDMMNSKEEAEIYKNVGLKEIEVGDKKCLVRPNINLNHKDEFGRTNKERMEGGKPPLTKDGEAVELHHIGQKPDSPLAELTIQEHRGKGNDIILHNKQKESEIDRNEFKKEREWFWSNRAKNV